jgi:hypothetical protein
MMFLIVGRASSRDNGTRLISTGGLGKAKAMAEFFRGRWRGTVVGRTANFSQRVLVSGGSSGGGAYNGVVGTTFEFADAQVELQWNNDAGSGWQPSAVITSMGMSSPLVITRSISADDNFPDQRDGDFDDLQVSFEYIDPLFAVDQRPFAVERGSRTMLPDGIFDTSQGVQYMGVLVRNTWFLDWHSGFPAMGMKIGIARASRAALAARGIVVRDDWQPAEQEAFGQVVDGGYVQVPDLDVGESTTIYFKVAAAIAAAMSDEIDPTRRGQKAGSRQRFGARDHRRRDPPALGPPHARSWAAKRVRAPARGPRRAQPGGGRRHPPLLLPGFPGDGPADTAQR